MNNELSEPPETWNGGRIIPVGQELPPMETEEDRRRKAERAAKAEVDAGKGEAKGKGKRQRGRFGVLNAFADDGARQVNPTAQACWWIVFRETKPDGLARISHGRIAECVGVSRATAIRAIRRLESAGLLTVVRRGGLHGGASTYRAHGTPQGGT